MLGYVARQLQLFTVRSDTSPYVRRETCMLELRRYDADSVPTARLDTHAHGTKRYELRRTNSTAF